MKVMSFDLSTVCIGIIAAKINENKDIEKCLSVPVKPPKFEPEKLGYCHSKVSVQTKQGVVMSSYVKIQEKEVKPIILTKAEKQRRDREVRSQKDIFVLEYIGKAIQEKIQNIEPDLILVEKNAIFNGPLTTVLLAKTMGALLGVAGSMNIPVKEYSVAEARSNFNIGKLVKDFCGDKTPEELERIPDVTKRALRDQMERKYNIRFLSDDESDACVVFNHWLSKDE